MVTDHCAFAVLLSHGRVSVPLWWDPYNNNNKKNSIDSKLRVDYCTLTSGTPIGDGS